MIDIQNTKSFSLKIEDMVQEKKISYMDAVVHYCDENGLEIETAAKLLNLKIKQTIQLEASRSNMMKEKIVELPIYF